MASPQLSKDFIAHTYHPHTNNQIYFVYGAALIFNVIVYAKILQIYEITGLVSDILRIKSN
jgi:hypothetical protein